MEHLRGLLQQTKVLFPLVIYMKEEMVPIMDQVPKNQQILVNIKFQQVEQDTMITVSYHSAQERLTMVSNQQILKFFQQIVKYQHQ